MVKARFGENIITDMRKLQKEREANCSSLWHQAALCAVNITQQLAYYKNCITSFKVLHSVLTQLYILNQMGLILSFMSRDGIRIMTENQNIALCTSCGIFFPIQIILIHSTTIAWILSVITTLFFSKPTLPTLRT